jgi:hypothetical protein
MNSKKVFYALLGTLVLIFVAAIAITYIGIGRLQTTGNELVKHKLDEAVLEKDEEALARAKEDVKKYSDLEAIAKAIVPQEKDQVRTVREIVSIAQSSDIKLKSISFPSSTLGTVQKKSKKTKEIAPTQLTPVEDLKGVFVMPITVESDPEAPVSYAQLLNFLTKLEKNRRTSHITNLSITPNEEDRSKVSFTLQINAYIKP